MANIKISNVKRNLETSIYTGKCVNCKDKTWSKRSMYCQKCFEAALSKKVKEEC